MSESLIQALQNPSIYPHPVEKFEVMQTHLSWVILTGPYAYKIKKPLNLGFQDFTTLEKRRHYCELEILYNQPFAPHLYLELIAITDHPSGPELNGKGKVLEYAVKMEQFQQTDLLIQMAHHNQLNAKLIEGLASQIAMIHLLQSADLHSQFGTPKLVWDPIQDNFTALKQLVQNNYLLEKIANIEAWAKKQFISLESLVIHRKATGSIKACHGDLHLGNIVVMNNKPIIFDCIEFNESFRWIDVMNDIGFLAMDLDHLKLNEFSQLLINTYLEFTADYAGVPLINFYKSYRAMVRAKVSALQLKQGTMDPQTQQRIYQDLEQFIDTALQYTQQHPPQLWVTVGASGCGKTLYTKDLLMKTDAIRLRTDSMRRHLYPLLTQEMLYYAPMIQSVYEKLRDQAEVLLKSGHSVIIDATCLKQAHRNLFTMLGKKHQVKTTLLVFEAPTEVLEQRIQHRYQDDRNISDADIAVLHKQLCHQEPLTLQEQTLMQPITTAEIDALIKRYSN